MEDNTVIPVEYGERAIGALEKGYGVAIKLYNGYYTNSGTELILDYKGYNLEQFTRWFWYFRYRACKLQMENPKKLVKLFKYQYEIKDVHQLRKERLKKLKDEITTKKRVITKTLNAMRAYEKQQENTLLPNYESKKYIRTKEKLESLQRELKILENESSAFTTTS